MRNLPLTIGETIASQRKEKGITQEVLAQNIGVSVQTVSKWETDVSSPDMALLPLIADYFDISIDYLFGRHPADGKKSNEIADLNNNSPHLFDAMLNKCWDIQLDAVYGDHTQEDAKEIKSNNESASQMNTGKGFTHIKNGLGFVAVQNPKDGWKAVFDNDDICELFKYLSNKNFMKVLSFLAGKGDYNFTLVGLSNQLEMDKSELTGYINALVKYQLVSEKKMALKEGEAPFYIFSTQMLPTLLVTLVYAREFIEQKPQFTAYKWNDEMPFI